LVAALKVMEDEQAKDSKFDPEELEAIAIESKRTIEIGRRLFPKLPFLTVSKRLRIGSNRPKVDPGRHVHWLPKNIKRSFGRLAIAEPSAVTTPRRWF
jgi:hypothetical protein